MGATPKSTQQKILITGGAGFIGGHLARHLIKLGYSLRILDLRKPDFTAESYQGDVRDPEFTKPHLDWADVVFHFAANVSVPYCEEHIVESYDNNFMATVKIADWIIEKKSRSGKNTRLVFASSAAVYGMNGCVGHSLKETDVSQTPLSYYAAQKLACEHALKIYAGKGLESVVFRFFNVYGLGQDPSSPYSGVMTIFAKAIRENSSIKIFGDGSYTRDFISVHDIVKACTAAIGAPSQVCIADAWNLGTSKTTSILELANLMVGNSGKKVPIEYKAPRVGDVPHSCASNELARKNLDWSPLEELSKNIQELI